MEGFDLSSFLELLGPLVAAWNPLWAFIVQLFTAIFAGGA